MKEESKSNVLIDKFLSHMFNINDLDHLILKGHILTENSLHFFIEMTSVEKINFKKTKLTYSTKIEMAKTLGLFKDSPILYSELKTLNKLRNSIAHNLKYDEKLFFQFIEGFEKHKDFLKTEAGSKFGKDKEYFENKQYKEMSKEGKLSLSMLYISSICMKIFSEGTKQKRN